MKIAYICADPGIPVFGAKGASIHVQEVLRALLKRGAEITLFFAKLGGEIPSGLETIRTVPLGQLPKGDVAQREQLALAANDQLYTTLAQAGPFDMVYERYSLWSYAGMEFAQATALPALLEVNAPLIEEQSQHRSLHDRQAAQAVARRVFAASTALLAVSADVSAYLNSFPEAWNKVHVVANGVDPARFSTVHPHAGQTGMGTGRRWKEKLRLSRHSPNHKTSTDLKLGQNENLNSTHHPLAASSVEGWDGAHFTIGFVGTLKAWHGLDVLVDAFSQFRANHPDARLLIVGDGPGRTAMEQTLGERGLLTAVHFTGMVEHEAIAGWLAQMDVAVAPYPELQSFYFSPLKVYEYMAAGKTVVASNIGQIAEVIAHGKNGLLCKPGDVTAFSNAFEQTYRHRRWARNLGRRARRTITTNHTWDHVADRILQLTKLIETDKGEHASLTSRWKQPLRALAAHLRPLVDLGEIIYELRQPIRSQWRLFAVSFFAMLLSIGLRLLEPWPLKIVFDRLGGSSKGVPLFLEGLFVSLDGNGLLISAALLFVAVNGLRAVLSYFDTVSLALAGNRVLTRIRADLYNHLLRLPLGFHSQARNGELLNILVGDIGRLQDVAVTAVMPLFVNLLTLIGMLTIMAWMNWRLALIALVALPLTSLIMARLTGQIRTAARQQRKREGDLAANAGESLAAIRLVQALSLEPMLQAEFSQSDQKNLKEGVKGARLAASLERTVDVFIGVATAIVLWYGARSVLNGVLSIGDLVLFLNYLKGAFRPMNDLAKYTGRIAKAVASGERVLALLRTESKIVDAPAALPAAPFAGEISFEHVHFAYENGHPILQDVSFCVKPGQRVAVVGPSGSGKSTLVSLLLRLHDPTGGRIVIDGQDLRTCTLASLRGQMSVVLQENLLFGVSVYENIRYGAPTATPEQIEAAARLANAHEFISAMPRGYASVLGERGATLSGGQRQRIAVARAALRQSPIVLLDEPTVGLDQENEHLLGEALDQLVAGRSSLWVTHNMHVAAKADVILFVEQGRVVEYGSHVELMRRNGRYATMVYLQTASGSNDLPVQQTMARLHVNPDSIDTISIDTISIDTISIDASESKESYKESYAVSS